MTMRASTPLRALVTHIDDEAIAALSRFYATLHSAGARPCST